MTGTPRAQVPSVARPAGPRGRGAVQVVATRLLVAASPAIAVAVIVWAWPPLGITIVASLTLMAWAADIDRRELRLPDRLVGAAALPLVAVATVSPAVPRLDALAPMALGLALLGAPIAAVHLISPAAMGFGDVKAGAVLGAAVGVVEPSLSLVVVCVASGAAGTWGIVRRRRAVPFGPFLVGSAVAVLVVAAWMGVEATAWQ